MAQLSPAKRVSLARIYLAFGLFLFVVGVLGYLSNPEKAKTAMLSGSVFGSASVLVSWALRKGHRKAWAAGVSLVSLLSGVFVWRSTVSWLAVAQGNSSKIVAASLITAMLLGSVSVLIMSVRQRRQVKSDL